MELTVDIRRKILLTKHVCQCPYETKEAAEWVADLKANKDKKIWICQKTP